MPARPNRQPGPSALRLEPLPDVLQRLLALGQRELAQDFRGDKRTRDHIHTLVRTPNGNDYGADLLRQHHERYDHSRADTPHRRGDV